mmetsp:Transcript_45560/g.145327  ORF Transcript_45560/g.145327 Transcript_45560/m.145327 type:complete len:390 (+) Transcript_45560:969-2138(+)
MGVRRCAARTTSTPQGPPKRIRRALRRNSAGSTSCSTAPPNSPVSISVVPGLSRSNASIPPRSLEKPSCTSTSSKSHASWAVWSCLSIASTKLLFSAARPSASQQAVQKADAEGSAPKELRHAAMRTSWWKAGLPAPLSQAAKSSTERRQKSSESKRALSSTLKAARSPRCASSVSRAGPGGKLLQSSRRSSSGSRAKRLRSKSPTLEERSATSRQGAPGTSSWRSSHASTSFSNPRTSCALDKRPSASSALSRPTAACRSCSCRSSAARSRRAASSSWKQVQPRAATEAIMPCTSLAQKNSSTSNAAFPLNSLNSSLLSSGVSSQVGLGELQSTSRHFGEICRANGAASTASSSSKGAGLVPLKDMRAALQWDKRCYGSHACELEASA